MNAKLKIRSPQQKTFEVNEVNNSIMLSEKEKIENDKTIYVEVLYDEEVTPYYHDINNGVVGPTYAGTPHMEYNKVISLKPNDYLISITENE